MDVEFRVHKPKKAKDNITNELHRMHIAIDEAFNCLEEADRHRAQQGSSKGHAANANSFAHSFASSNFLNTQILLELKYTGVSLIALNKNISNMGKWHNLVLEAGASQQVVFSGIGQHIRWLI